MRHAELRGTPYLHCWVMGRRSKQKEQDEPIDEEKIYPNVENEEQPPEYQAAGPSGATLKVEPAPYTRYDTMTSYAGLDTQQGGGSIKIDPAVAGQTSYIVANNMIGGALDEPFPVQCPFCHNVVTTKTVHVTGCLTYLSCLAVGVVTTCCGCCLIPLCLDRCKDVKHYCPECNHLIAIYRRL